MADHSKPTVTSLYANFVAELGARFDDLALMLDPAKTTASNIPTGAIRWDSASSKWQIWSGTAWGNLAATYAINALTASSAAKWTTARTLALSGDVTGSTTIDGSANKTITATLSNTGVAAGTYNSVTVDAKGRVTGATNPTTLPGYGITDAVPSADVAQVPAANKIVKATADGPIDLGWLDAAVARELRMLAVVVNPSLDLNFGRQNYRRQNGAKGLETLADPFAGFIDFTRSTTASYFGADGLLKTAGIDEPRIEYDPISGECKGLLIEESRANLIGRSEELDHLTWTKTRISVVANVSVAPNGEITADKIVEDTSASSSHVLAIPVAAIAPTQVLTLSVYAKAAERYELGLVLWNQGAAANQVRGAFNLAAKTAVASIVGNGRDAVATIEDVGGGWFRCSISGIPDVVGTTSGGSVATSLGGVNSYTGDGTSGLYIWGAQLEAGSFPTSYIKTEASAVTRGADNASVTGANFSSWYRQDEGALVARLDLANIAQIGVSEALGLSLSGGTANNRISLVRSAAGNVPQFIVSSDGALQGAPYGSAVDKNKSFGLGLSFANNDLFVATNGIAGIQDDEATIPFVDRLYFGDHMGLPKNAVHISRLTYWPKRLTNTQLQELSK